MFFTKRLSIGFFGGEGFILQKLIGNGLVLLKGGGATIVKTLAAGEQIRVSSGSIIAFESTVDYDITMVTGAKNIIFGGQGLFLTTLTGPGTIWLQGLPFDKLVAAIPQGQTGSASGDILGRMAGGAVGGAVGGAAGSAAGGAAAGAVGGAAAETIGHGSQTGNLGDFANQDKNETENNKTNDDEDDVNDDDSDSDSGGGGWFSSLFGSDD